MPKMNQITSMMADQLLSEVTEVIKSVTLIGPEAVAEIVSKIDGGEYAKKITEKIGGQNRRAKVLAVKTVEECLSEAAVFMTRVSEIHTKYERMLSDGGQDSGESGSAPASDSGS